MTRGHLGPNCFLDSFFVNADPSKSTQRYWDAAIITQLFERTIPPGRKQPEGARRTERRVLHFQLGFDEVIAKLARDAFHMIGVHAQPLTNYLSTRKTNDGRWRSEICHGIFKSMDLLDRPFGDIADRLRWHRDLVGLTQKEYAAKIGVKRQTLNNWESGDYRLSLDGALALRKTYGLSIDFMIEGNSDALPMTLRQAWLDRP